MKPFKPMLAATSDGHTLKFPLLASPKLDGIRAIVIDGVVVSRNLKPIPNQHVQNTFGLAKFNGLDGELIVGNPTDPKAFSNTSSGVMSISGIPDASFHVFDCINNREDSYMSRLSEATRIVNAAQDSAIKVVPHTMLGSLQDLQIYELEVLALGWEGVMLRGISSPYKYGRGTVSKQDLLKLKRFSDDEARVIGFAELMHNANAATVGRLGQTERSRHADGLQGKDTLGALLVEGITGRFANCIFSIGTGFDAAMRQTIWDNQNIWLGKVVKYKHFEIGAKDLPRFPVFLGERNILDM